MATAYNEFKLIGPSDEEQYTLPSDVTVSCRLSPEISAVNMEIRWFKETDCVCVYKNRQVTVGTGYEDRVSLFTEELDRGNVSLQLRDCKWSDSGHYLCQVTDGDRTEEITVEMNPLLKVYVEQSNREWTEDERMKMEKSALQTELQGASKSLRAKDQQLEDCKRQIEDKDTELRNREKIIKEKDAVLKDTNTKLEKTTEQLQERERTLQERDQQLTLKDKQIQETQIQVEEMEKRLVEKNKELEEKNEQLNVVKERNEKTLSERDAVLMETNEKLQNATKQNKETNIQLETLGQELQDKKRQLQEMEILLEQQKTDLAEKKQCIEEKERLLTESETQLMERDKQLQEKDKLLEEKTKLLQDQTDPESPAPIRRRNSRDELPPNMSEETQDSAAPIRRRNSNDGTRPTLSVEASPPHPVSVPVPELRIVLLGRTGSGKSAAGNTILGREERNQASTSTVTSTATQQSEITQGEVAGRKVSVIDTSDWFSPGLSLEKVRQDVGLCVHLSAPGPHVFFLVIPVKHLAGEERGILEKMEEIFGERCWRNTMIMFTVTDELQKKNIAEFIHSGDQEIRRLVDKCGNRFHCLNIKESGDGSQVSELLEKIEKMVEGTREKFYSSEIYLEIESQIRAMETKIMTQREQEQIRKEIEVKEKFQKKVQDSLRKIEGVIHEHEGDIRKLNDRTTELERKMKEERDEEKKRELEMELKQEVARRTEMEKKVKKLKEKREKERREVEERHQQEMEEIREVYKGEARIEAERNLLKIIMPEILALKTKMQEEFSIQMEEKHRELETLNQKLFKATETHSLLREAYNTTVLDFTEPEQE